MQAEHGPGRAVRSLAAERARQSLSQETNLLGADPIRTVHVQLGLVFSVVIELDQRPDAGERTRHLSKVALLVRLAVRAARVQTADHVVELWSGQEAVVDEQALDELHACLERVAEKRTASARVVTQQNGGLARAAQFVHRLPIVRVNPSLELVLAQTDQSGFQITLKLN